MMRERNNINISGVTGDVIGIGVEGKGHIFGKNITIGSININEKQLKKIPKEYANSLENFSKSVNEQLKHNEISQEKVDKVQKNINELATEVEDIQSDQKISMVKKKSIDAKFTSIVEGLLKILPKTAETLTTFTPLAPFGKLIGQSVEEVVRAIQKEV